MKPQILTLLALLAAGCTTARPAGAGAALADLAGATWRLVQIERPGTTAVAPGDRTYTLAFGADGRYRGQADCDRYEGAFRVEPDGRLDLDGGLSTLAACAPPSVAGDVLALLGEAETVDLDGDRLRLRAGDGRALVFERTPDFGGMPPQETLRDHAYACDSGGGPFTFRIRTGPGEIALWLPARFEGRPGGTYLVLGQVVAASGAKYQDGPVTVWTHGGEALLAVDGAEYPACVAQR